MYNLRSKSGKIQVSDTEQNTVVMNLSEGEDVDKVLKRKCGSSDRTGKQKLQKVTKEKYIETPAFNPCNFEKYNGYEGIFDSSDSNNQSSESHNSSEYDDPNESSSVTHSVELDENGCEDGEYNADTYDYFDVDTNPLIGIIAKRLKSSFPELDEKELTIAVKKAISKANADLVEEYCTAIPKDSSWKAGLEEDEVTELEPQLKVLRKNIRENTPTIPSILRSNLSISEKERALQFYDILNNIEPYSFDYMWMKMRITEIIKSAPKELNPDADKNALELHSIMESNIPTVEKILSARLTKSDKISALQLYESLQQCYYKSGEWFNIQRQINYILESQLESDDAVAKLEADETNLQTSNIHFTTDLKRKIFELDADPDIKSRIYGMYSDMISRRPNDHGYNELRDKILWAIKLPYRRKTPAIIHNMTPEGIREYCIKAYNSLDAEIYGMKDAKMRIIQTLNDRIYNPISRSLLALKGSPGVGKTKLAKTIAKIAGLPFDKISLGGAIDSTMFKGSDNVWSGASPSLLLQILSRVKYSNAVILLDEFDKLGSTDKGIEVQNSLLHVLDPSQNKEFQDAFLNEFHHDISNIWFIPAMNDDSLITPALRDRLDIIEIPTYNRHEMVQIIKLHTLPETLRDKGIPDDSVVITDQASYHLLNKLGSEVKDSGMRPVEKAINSIISRINFLRTMCSSDNTSFNSETFIPYKLKDFTGFPYTITVDSINVLHPKTKEISLSYFI